MASDLCAFLRPINITSSNNSWSVDGGAKTITTGTYGSILSVIHEFDDNCGANFNVYLTAAFKVCISHNDNFTILWTDTALRDMLGFTGLEDGDGDSGELSGMTSYTATYPPYYCWLPTYASYDRERFAIDQKETFQGATVKNGRTVGISTGPDIKYRQLKFACEPASNVFIEAADTHVSQRYRSWEYFIQQCRTVQPSAATDAPCKGFYFFADRSDVIAMADDNPATKASGDGGVLVSTAVGSESDYVFCHLDSAGAGTPTPSLPVTRSYYHVDMTIHTATAPSWDV